MYTGQCYALSPGRQSTQIKGGCSVVTLILMGRLSENAGLENDGLNTDNDSINKPTDVVARNCDL